MTEAGVHAATSGRRKAAAASAIACGNPARVGEDEIADAR